MKNNLRNVRPKAVKIMLDKERNLVFDLNAFAELEEIFGSVEEALKSLEKGSLKAIITLLWSGLVHEDETLTIKEVGAMISINDLARVSEALAEAVKGDMPDPVKKDSNAGVKSDPNA